LSLFYLFTPKIVEEAPPKSHVLDIGDCGGAAKLDYGFGTLPLLAISNFILRV
jgi:hypothetical protein